MTLQRKLSLEATPRGVREGKPLGKLLTDGRHVVVFFPYPVEEASEGEIPCTVNVLHTNIANAKAVPHFTPAPLHTGSPKTAVPRTMGKCTTSFRGLNEMAMPYLCSMPQMDRVGHEREDHIGARGQFYTHFVCSLHSDCRRTTQVMSKTNGLLE